MLPLVFVVFQLLVIAGTYAVRIRREPSRSFRFLYIAIIGGVIGFDVWYLVDFAYPLGFGLGL